jgi:hypothetical protein
MRKLQAKKASACSYSGYSAVAGANPAAPHIVKPAPMHKLLTALEELLPRESTNSRGRFALPDGSQP